MRGSLAAEAQSVIAQVFEVTVCAAGFMAGHAAEAAIDRLAFEVAVGFPDFADDFASGELGHAGVPVEPVDDVEDRVAAARAAIGDLRLKRWDGDGRPVDGVVAVRIV